MIYLFTVASPARSGTKWYSELFTVDHSYCYHELAGLLQPYPTNLALLDWLETEAADHDFEQTQRRTLLQGFPQYFARLWERAFFGQYVVGNSDSMTRRFAPALWLLWPDMRFLFSFRNGINAVNSRLVWESHVPEWVRSSEEKRYGAPTYFAQCCHVWREQVELLRGHQAWLTEHGAQLVETRLEDVTSDEEELHRVWDFIVGYWDKYAERNRQLMSRLVNTRVNGDGVVSSEQVWERWSPDQQATFVEICGASQQALGYELPTLGSTAAGATSRQVR